MGVNADLLFMEQFIIVSSDSNAIVPNIQAMFSSFFANIDIEIHITKERCSALSPTFQTYYMYKFSFRLPCTKY
jgi:hypothetical protein